MDAEFLKILACPETRTPLTLADDALIASANEKVRAGTLSNRDGKTLEEELDGGLVRQDGTVLYPIVDGIPILLIEESIAVTDLRS